MIGSFLTRGLLMIFGYAYPAYECYKTVEKNKPEIEQLRFWCQYWILVSVLTVCERIGDAFISWVPMYSEAKLAFYIYLWYPKTKGTSYVYDSFFRPYVARHETEIDRNLLELRTRAGDMAVLYWQRAASYGQTRIFDILQYIASQSTPRPRPAQPQQDAKDRRPPPASTRQPAASAQPETEEPPSPTSSTSSSQYQTEVLEEVGPSSQVSGASPRVKSSGLQRANSTSTNLLRTNSTSSNPQKANSAASNAQKATTTAPNAQKANAASEINSHSTPPEAEAMQVDAVPSPANENENPPSKETFMEETLRVTRGRLRKNRSASNH